MGRLEEEALRGRVILLGDSIEMVDKEEEDWGNGGGDSVLFDVDGTGGGESVTVSGASSNPRLNVFNNILLIVVYNFSLLPL